MDELFIQTIILIIGAILIYVLVRRSKFKKYKSLKANYKYEFSRILFIVYIVGLLGVLLLPVIRMGYSNNNGFYCHIVTYEWDYNLIPFKTISEQLGFLNSDMDKAKNGLLNLFVKHTSCALTINENADPDVRTDMESIFNHVVPERQPYYIHTLEGDDDMPAHAKSTLSGVSLTIPITNHRLNLGTWQGVYLCEYRHYGGSRRIVVTIIGE